MDNLLKAVYIIPHKATPGPGFSRSSGIDIQLILILKLDNINYKLTAETNSTFVVGTQSHTSKIILCYENIHWFLNSFNDNVPQKIYVYQ